MENTSLATTAQIFRKLLELNGLDAVRLFEESGLSPSVSDDPNARIPIKVADALIVRAAALITDEAWGIKAARCWHPSNLGVLGLAWFASSTLRTGLQRLIRYWHILGDRATTRLVDAPDGPQFIYEITGVDPLIEALCADLVLSVVLDMCRMNAEEPLKPMQVTLRRKLPTNPDHWDHFFGCSVTFGAPHNSFTLTTSAADRALSTSNRPLAGVLDNLLAEQLGKLARADIVSRCKAEFVEQLVSGEPSAEDIAQHLHMSERTLQRKLSEVNTSYKKLLDDTKHEMALRLIGDSTKSITDITFLLGFSGQSSFNRAFKRWTGLSPTAFRRRSASTS